MTKPRARVGGGRLLCVFGKVSNAEFNTPLHTQGLYSSMFSPTLMLLLLNSCNTRGF